MKTIFYLLQRFDTWHACAFYFTKLKQIQTTSNGGSQISRCLWKHICILCQWEWTVFFFIANISSKIQKFECFFFHYHKKQPRFYGISCLNPPQSTPDKLKEMLILRISLSERRSLQQLLEIKTISTTSSFTDPVRQYDL